MIRVIVYGNENTGDDMVLINIPNIDKGIVEILKKIVDSATSQAKDNLRRAEMLHERRQSIGNLEITERYRSIYDKHEKLRKVVNLIHEQVTDD